MADRDFPIDFANFTPDDKPRRFLVLPADLDASAKPDLESPRLGAEPKAVLDAFIAVALDEPRTELLRQDGLQAELLQKTKVLGFRDFITVEAVPGEEGTAMAIYSRSAVGYWDMNVNRKRIERWLSALGDRLSA